VIGEAIGRLALRLKERRRQRALRWTQFDGVCPQCGEQMNLLKRKTEYMEGGAYCPGYTFVCHGCEVSLWHARLERRRTPVYREL